MRGLLRRPGLVRAPSVSCVVLAAVDITLVHLPALGAERGIASGVIGALLARRGAASMTSRLSSASCRAGSDAAGCSSAASRCPLWGWG